MVYTRWVDPTRCSVDMSRFVSPFFWQRTPYSYAAAAMMNTVRPLIKIKFPRTNAQISLNKCPKFFWVMDEWVKFPAYSSDCLIIAENISENQWSRIPWISLKWGNFSENGSTVWWSTTSHLNYLSEIGLPSSLRPSLVPCLSDRVSRPDCCLSKA